jgi:cytochrome c oxidase subunit II
MSRRPLVALLLALVLPLAWAGAGLAAPGGIGPPAPHTDSGKTINELYWVVFTICAIVFVSVETALVLFVIRFRRRRGTPEDVEGPQIHGNTRLEIIWTLAPTLVLVGIAVFTFARIPAVQASGDTGNELRVRVEAHQFYWQYVYPNGAISLDDLRLPVGRPIALEITTFDVNHSWWVPPLTGKMDAIAGRTNVLRFKPEGTGTWEGQCAELCGVQHAVMYTRVQVVPQAAFDSWVEATARAQQHGGGLGRQTWTAVCAKCHGFEGEGLVGPAIAGNGTLTTKPSLKALVEQGQNTPQFDGYMPPVGLGWPQDGRQLDALIAYVKSNAKLVQAAGGATGGG